MEAFMSGRNQQMIPINVLISNNIRPSKVTIERRLCSLHCWANKIQGIGEPYVSG